MYSYKKHLHEQKNAAENAKNSYCEIKINFENHENLEKFLADRASRKKQKIANKNAILIKKIKCSLLSENDYIIFALLFSNEELSERSFNVCIENGLNTL